MIKKSKILTLILICIPLLLSIGFSSWIIIHTIEVMSEYKNAPTSDLFDSSQSTTYDGSLQLPASKDGADLNGNEVLTYQYKLESEKTYKDVTSTVGPINAGTYDVLIKVSGSTNGKYDGFCQVKFVINKRHVKLSTTEFSLTYEEAAPTYYGVKTIINPKLSYVDIENNKINEQLAFIYGMHNGVYYFGETNYKVDGLTTTQNGSLAGSTYSITVKMYDDVAINNVFVDDYDNELPNAIAILKYKTAKIGSNWYTIEDAISTINDSSDTTISFAGDNSDNSSYVETCFTKITKAEGNPYIYDRDNKLIITLNAGKTILVPYRNSTTDKETYEASGIKPTNYFVYSALTIPSGLTLNIDGTLIIGAKIGFNQPNATITLDRGVLLNNGTLNINDGGVVKSYGYIKGNGIINLENGSRATDAIRGYDFPGGTTTLKIMGDTFPMNTWTLNNISCKTYIKNGARYYGHVYISVSGISANDEYLIIGTTDIQADKNCIFRSASSNAKHIVKYAINARTTSASFDYEALNNINGSNQIPGQRTIFEIDGDYCDATFQITVGNAGSFSTSDEISLTMPFADIIVKEGTNLSIANSDYLFLPGSKVLIETGAIVNVSSGIDLSFADYATILEKSTGDAQYSFPTYCVDKTDAELIVNGILVMNGNVGGKITSEAAGGAINLPSTASTTANFKSLYHAIGGLSGSFANADQMRYSASVPATGNINSQSGASFVAGNYYISERVGTSDEYTWKIEENVKTFKIIYNDESGSIKTILIGIPGATSYTFTGTDFRPTKDYYDFVCWTNSSGINIEGTSFTEETINVYASWTEKTYNLQYLYFIENADGTLTQIFSEGENKDINLTPNVPSDSTFTISDLSSGSMEIDSHPIYANKYFNGWYFPAISITESGVKIEIDDNYKIDFIMKKEHFDYVISKLRENNQREDVIPIVCKFTASKKYNIIVEHTITGETVAINYNELTFDNTVNFPNLSGYYTNHLYDKYLDYWTLVPNNTTYKVDKDTTLEYIVKTLIENMSSENLTEFQSKYNSDDATPTIKIYGQASVKKLTLTHLNDANNDGDYDDTGETINHYAVDATQKIYTSSATTKNYKSSSPVDIEYTSFKYWKDSNNNTYNAETEIQLSDNMILYSDYNEKYWCIVSYSGDSSGAATATISVTHNGVAHESGKGIEKGGKVSYTANGSYALGNYKLTVKYGSVTKTSSSTISESDIEINQHTTFTASAEVDGCVIFGTLITLSDGTQKKIEEINGTEKLLVLNHYTGKLESIPIGMLVKHGSERTELTVTKLKFDNNICLSITGDHTFFNVSLNKYININEFNVKDYIGDEFLAYSNGLEKVKLINAEVVQEETIAYSIISYKHLTCFTDSILTATAYVDQFLNAFDIDPNTYQYDLEKMKNDIDKYGIFEYNDVSDIFTKDEYEILNVKYYKIAIEKGYISYDEFIQIFEMYKYYKDDITIIE